MAEKPPTRTFRTRVGNFFRSTRVRAVILLVGGYNVYNAAKNYNTIYKPFSGHRHRPGETVLDLNLESVTIVQHDALRPFSSAEEMRLERLVSTLKAAKKDPRVGALIVRGMSGLSTMGLAELTELRNAIRDFSQGWGGKHTMLHVPDGFGLGGNGTIPLYFSSVFDSVHVQPTSPVVIPGISLATLFFKRMLDKIGLEAKKVARKDFKTAANLFTEEKFTDAHRESTLSLLDAIMTDVVTGISNGRRISEQSVRDAIDTGLMTPAYAHDVGLVDRPLHRDQLPEEMRNRLRAAAKQRVKIREEAAREWRAAMRALVEAWNMEGSAIDLWEDGTVNANLANFNFAVPMSVTMTDTRQEVMRAATEAEIRALKAHIRWLDTCPWEAFYDYDKEEDKENSHDQNSTKNDSDNIYNSIPYISSLLNLERRLCEHGIRTLEEFPKLVDSHRKEGDNGDVLELDVTGSFEVVRWVRSVWKAKCLASRMVGTLTEIEGLATQAYQSKGENDILETENEIEAHVFKPRPFLVGFVENLKPYKVMNEVPKLVKPDNTEKTEIDVEVVSNEDGKQLVSTLVTKPKKDPMKLYYMRLADYADLVISEHRAYAERGNPLVRLEPENPFPFLYGMVDGQDRQGLIRLASPGLRLAPWRLNIPKGHVVAVIHVEGVISDEDADSMRSAIRRADKDPHIKAIVLRIDSPGGSAIASDIIARAVDVAKKPVVASMGTVCASGGYYISAPCNLVFASPMTITGSIGVIMQSFNSAKLFDNVGITGDSVESGKFAKYFGVLGIATEWSEEFRRRLDDLIDTSYADFLQVVAKGRGLNMEETEAVAQGRVWAGQDALRLRLVDKIGGLQDAIEAAGELANLAPDEAVRAVDYPTLAMQLQDAAKRRGIIPANLDEEGDEVVSEKRKRRWPWSSRKDEEQEPNEIGDTALSPAAEAVPGEYQGLSHFFLSRFLVSLDKFLMSMSGSSWTSSAIESLLGNAIHLLNKRQSQDWITSELEVVRATAGRPAAIAPNIRIDE